MTVRDRFLVLADRLRKIPGKFGIRRHSVSIRVRTWSGSRVGLGTKTDVTTAIKVGKDLYNPNVVEVDVRDVVASGGKYQAGDFKVGPISHEYSYQAVTYGYSVGEVNPDTGASPKEVLYKLEGNGFPSDGQWCELVEESSLTDFRIMLTLRPTGRVA